MKKMLYILLAAALLCALLAGCGAKTEAPAAETPAAVGGWTMPEEIAVTEETRAIFEKGAEQLVGVNYKPLALLGTQLVNGTNRAYFCSARVVYPDAKPFFALVHVYEALDGATEILNIQAITPDGRIDENAGAAGAAVGSWTVPEEAEADEAVAALIAAAEKQSDLALTPIVPMGRQLVSGTNYCLLCRAEPASGEAPYFCFVQVYRDLQGSAEIQSVTVLDTALPQ